MQKNVKLYNMIFPLRSFFIFPPLFLVSLPANFVIDSLVLVLAGIFLKLKNLKTIYKKSIWKIWGFGFLADALGAGFLLLSELIEDRFWVPYSFTSAINYNPWEHWFSLVWTMIGLGISAFLIFYFNQRWSFSKTDLTAQEKQTLAILLAIFTAPYLFLIPLHWII